MHRTAWLPTKKMLTVARYRMYRTVNGVFVNAVTFCLEPMLLTFNLLAPTTVGARINRKLPEYVGDKNPRKQKNSIVFCVAFLLSFFILFHCKDFVNQHHHKIDPGLQ